MSRESITCEREGRTEPGKLDDDHRCECSISKEIHNQSAGEKSESAAVAEILVHIVICTHSTGSVTIVITAVAIAKSTKFNATLVSDWRYAANPSTITENTTERPNN